MVLSSCVRKIIFSLKYIHVVYIFFLFSTENSYPQVPVLRDGNNVIDNAVSTTLELLSFNLIINYYYYNLKNNVIPCKHCMSSANHL